MSKILFAGMWLLISVVFFFVENKVKKNFCIWLGLSAVCSLLMGARGFSFSVQFWVFVCVGVLLLLIARPISKKLM